MNQACNLSNALCRHCTCNMVRLLTPAGPSPSTLLQVKWLVCWRNTQPLLWCRAAVTSPPTWPSLQPISLGWPYLCGLTIRTFLPWCRRRSFLCWSDGCSAHVAPFMWVGYVCQSVRTHPLILISGNKIQKIALRDENELLSKCKCISLFNLTVYLYTSAFFYEY